MTVTDAFFDTNLLVYAFENEADNRCAQCKELVMAVFEGEKTFTISNQVLAEFFNVVRRKLAQPMRHAEAQEFVELLVENQSWRKIEYTGRTVVQAIELARAYSISFWDALIAATMIDNKVYTIYTENEKDFSRIPGLKVINPLKS